MTESRGNGSAWITAAAAVAVFVLALGAVLWPRGGAAPGVVPLLVYDPSGRADRIGDVYEPLAALLGEAAGRQVSLQVFGSGAALLSASATGPAFVLAPDGLALALDRRAYTPLVCGRGPVPRNLRPESVLLWRRTAGDAARPWSDRAARTVAGDSLSLAGTAAGAAAAAPTAAGPDPYDHGPALHAARLGAFDYAIVRQWDADRFFAAGLLDTAEWGVRPLSGPLPDVVLMASRAIPRGQRLAVAEALAALGVREAAAAAPAARLAAGLERLQLAGFGMLLEPDWDLVRGQVPSDWPGNAQ